MKSRSLIIVLIVLFSIIAFILTIIMILLLHGNFKVRPFGIIKTSEQLIIDKSYEKTFENIKLDVNAGNIEIQESSDDLFHLIVYGEKEDINVKEENTLQITSRVKPCIFFCINRQSKIKLSIPKNFKGQMDIMSKYGDIAIGNFEYAVMNIKSDYGDVSIEKADKLNVKLSAGDIEIGNANNIKIINNLGDINIHNVNEFLDIEDDCGDIEIDNINILKNSYIKNSMGNIEIGQTNIIRIDAKTSLGNTDIRTNDYNSNIVLTINNNCGDIEVNN